MAKPLPVQLPAPSDQEDFEDLCEQIAREYWQDPTAARYGTRGHNQHGVDIVSPLALDNGEKRVIGIQCKKKKLLTNKKLTKRDINDTLKKVNEFRPKLGRLVFATTNPKDIKIQDYINELNIQRQTDKEFPLVTWFWEDIEKILQNSCPNTYMQYLINIIPEGGKKALSRDYLVEMLRIVDDYVQNNKVESATLILAIIDERIDYASDPELNLIRKRLNLRILVKEEKSSEAEQAALEIIGRFNSDIESLSIMVTLLINRRDYIQASELISRMRSIDDNHRLTKNCDLLYKYFTDDKIDYIRDEEFNGTYIENATACQICHLYAFKMNDKVNRDFYLRKQRAYHPKSSSAVVFEIIYKNSDLLEHIEKINLSDVENVRNLIQDKENELKERNPLTRDNELKLIFEKLRLDVLISNNFRPSYKPSVHLRESALSKICESKDVTSVFIFIDQLLRLICLDKSELSRLIGYINGSVTSATASIRYMIVAQAILNDGTYQYAETLCDDFLPETEKVFISALKSKNRSIVIDHLRQTEANLWPAILSIIDDNEFCIDLINNLDPGNDSQLKKSLTYLKILRVIWSRSGNYIEYIRKEVKFSELSYSFLEEIARDANQNNLWDLESECIQYMLKFQLDETEAINNEARLSVSLYKLQDYPGVLEKKDLLICGLEKMEDRNRKTIIKIMLHSAIELNQLYLAYELINSVFDSVLDVFEFHFYKADIELKLEKYDSALSTIVRGFRVEKAVSRDMYKVCYLLLNELANAGVIGNSVEDHVKDNVYIKVSGIDKWFYVGFGDGIDSSTLTPSDERYIVVEGKPINALIDWPSDQFQSDPPKRRIENILSEGLYLRFRAQEAIQLIADEGSGGVWAINIKDAKSGVENIWKFLSTFEKRSEDFYKSYISSPLPLSFLAKSENGLDKAIGKIIARQNGFIHINNGTQAVEESQVRDAHQILEGASAFIDALSLLFLVGSDFYVNVIKNIRRLFYTPSVTTYIRHHASQFAQSRFQLGSMGFMGNKVAIFDYDYKKELETRNRFLEAVDYFEKNANKVTTEVISSKKVDIESHIEPGIADPLSVARVRGDYLISDDYFYHKTLEILGIEPLVRLVSTLALVRALYEKGRISFDQYVDYRAYLIKNRCKHINITADIILSVVYAKTQGGIVLLRPDNIEKLQLDLTLSMEYGVPSDISSKIISEFLVNLIQDPAVDIKSFSDVLDEFIVPSFKNRERDFGGRVKNMCKTKLENSIIVIPHSSITISLICYARNWNAIFRSIVFCYWALSNDEGNLKITDLTS